MIINALSGKNLPIYGNGSNIRDWLYVEDHVRALYMILKNGLPGEDYNIGANSEMKNIEVVEKICNILNKLVQKKPKNIIDFQGLNSLVDERPGHDLRYAINSTKIMNDLSWSPEETFESGLYRTVKWYLDNKTWWQKILDNNDNQKMNKRKGIVLAGGFVPVIGTNYIWCIKAIIANIRQTNDLLSIININVG